MDARVARDRVKDGSTPDDSMTADGQPERQIEVPAQLLRRILSLSNSVRPDIGVDGFSRQLAELFSEVGGFAFSVVYFYDATDEAYYAEAMYGVSPDDWPEILAVCDSSTGVRTGGRPDRKQ